MGSYNFLNEKHKKTFKLSAIGCDGTPVNKGHKGGAITILENKLEKNFQWLICLFHCNKLPVGCLFQHYDGPQTGPKQFSGPISKAIADCENLEVVPFQKIRFDAPDNMK